MVCDYYNFRCPNQIIPKSTKSKVAMPVASRSSCGYRRSAFDVVLDAITTGFTDSKSSPCRIITLRPVACASVTPNIFFFVSKYLSSIYF